MKENGAIRELFECSTTRYYQMLNTLIDDPAALKADPMLVKRLRRRIERDPAVPEVILTVWGSGYKCADV